MAASKFCVKHFLCFLLLISTVCFEMTFARDQTRTEFLEHELKPIGTPYFLEEPENITTRLGQKVVLGCRVANANESIQWTRGGFGLGTKEHISEWGNLRILDPNPETDWNLEINPVTLDDDAAFQCQVPVALLQSRLAHVTVWVPPENPRILDGPIVQVKENVDVSLKCESKGGKPAAKINWFDHNGNLINDASYQSRRMSNSKLFEAYSVVSFTPTKDHHNVSLRCQAWNEAADSLKPATVRLHVQYAPSVTVTPVRPGMVEEGQEAIFRCSATANPPVFENSYKWYIDEKLIAGQSNFYFKINNVTRGYHDKQVMCRVENELGTASGIRTIEVKYGPKMTLQPISTSGDRLSTIVLYCHVDSNPAPKYYWTMGSSREIISEEQNLTLTVSEHTVGTYICQAETEGFDSLISKPVEVLMTGPPRINTLSVQTGVVGENVHINCAAISIPEAKEVHWRYHGEAIDDGNPHYRIINSPVEHGLRSTLIIRQALPTDFGPYTCSLKNSHGYSSFEISLEEQQPFPLQFILICTFAVVIFLLLVAIITILYRKKVCCSSYKSKKSNSSNSLDIRVSNNGALAAANNAIMKVNNLDQLSYDSTHIKRDLHSPTVSNENDSLRDGSETQDGVYRSNNNSTIPCGTQLYHNTSDMDSDFPPKPDVISGCVSNSHFVRDLYPPGLLPGQESPLYGGPGCSNTYNPNSRQSSMLNVSDPRYSATYGNPYLRQTGPRNMQYSTFCPAPQGPNSGSVIHSGVNTSTFHPTSNSMGGGTSTNTLNSLLSSGGGHCMPMTNLAQIPVSSSTPNSSISNMACLPEEAIITNSDLMPNTGISVMPLNNGSPSPPPPPVPSSSSSQVPIYVKLNGYRQNPSPRLDPLASPTEQKGGIIVSSSNNGNVSYPIHYHGNGSLPRHALQQSFAYKSGTDQGNAGGAMPTTGLATRV